MLTTVFPSRSLVAFSSPIDLFSLGGVPGQTSSINGPSAARTQAVVDRTKATARVQMLRFMVQAPKRERPPARPVSERAIIPQPQPPVNDLDRRANKRGQVANHH